MSEKDKDRLCFNKKTFSDGNVYEGNFKDDKPHGKGIMIYTDGRVYEGDWVEGKRHGKGKTTCPDGKVEEGYWEDDILIKILL